MAWVVGRMELSFIEAGKTGKNSLLLVLDMLNLRYLLDIQARCWIDSWSVSLEFSRREIQAGDKNFVLSPYGWYVSLCTWMETIKRVSVEREEIRTKDWDWGNEEHQEKDPEKERPVMRQEENQGRCCLSSQAKKVVQGRGSFLAGKSSKMMCETWPLDLTLILATLKGS